MQVKRLVISLDPEYIPWETEVVRLRRRKIKVGKKGVFVILAVALIAISLIVVLTVGKHSQSANATPAPVVAPSPSPIPATFAPPTLAPVGKPGALAVVRDSSLTFYPCQTFTVWEGETIIATGETLSAPVVNITGKVVRIACNHEIFELGE